MYTHTYCIYIYNVLYRSVFLSPLLPTTLYMYVYIHMWSQCTPQFTSERESANLILGHEVSSPPPNSCWIIDCLDGFPVDIKGVYMYICGYIYVYMYTIKLVRRCERDRGKKNFFYSSYFFPSRHWTFFFCASLSLLTIFHAWNSARVSCYKREVFLFAIAHTRIYPSIFFEVYIHICVYPTLI